MRVIVTDDEEGMREGMRRVLQKQGFEVDCAEDGSRAIELLKENEYDLALVDLKMPGIDGFKVTEFINERFGNRTIVVIVSALATVEAAVEVTSHGAFDFLVKPFTPRDLLQVVERASSQHKLISEREKYLIELNSERNLSRTLINSMQEGVLVLNINKMPVLINPRAEFLLGLKYKENMELGELGFSTEVIQEVEAVVSAGKEGGEIRFANQEMGAVVVQIRVVPHIHNNEFSGVIINLIDITREWKAEKIKNQFISMVAHELTSPLAAIINYINIILRGMFDDNIEKIHEVLDKSRIRGEALLDLIKDLQFLNKRDAGKNVKSLEPFDLREIVGDQLEFMKIEAEDRKIATCIEENGTEFIVSADKQDLDRIFVNLISNGIKYNRENGELLIRIVECKDKDVIEVRIKDTGIGMSGEEMEGLFQEFYRVKNPTTKGISGTGLGLATVRRVLGEYNGKIKVESEKGTGSEFIVELPKKSR
jgi:two-component system, OmpR family, phosphate regulon sensor histidine kinase PhoR